MKLAFLCCLIVGGFPSHASTIAFGSLTDPIGDSVLDDLIFGSITIDSTNVATFVLRFTPSSFLPGFSMGVFVLDLDRNPLTGFAGVDGANTDSSLIGADAIIYVPFLTNPYGRAYTWNGSNFNLGATQYSFTTLGDGYSMSVPLGDFNASSPVMNFKVVSARALTSNTSTGVRDRMSDVGSAVGSVSFVASPEPSTLFFAATGLATLLLRRKIANKE